ncbi:MAG TPA: hypothetical protein VKY86_18885 [Promicromonospora sp.]|nr:hypothetical protein [Promicromonospora sp.]
MSETNAPQGAGPGSQQQWASGPPGGGSTSGGTGVKERVSDAASQVGDAGRETAHEAKEKARDVAHEASDQVHGLADRARTELRSQMGAQQQHLAGGLRSLGDELGRMAGAAEDPGYASDLVSRAGDVTGRVAGWFEDREPGDVLHEVESFARRNPGTFVLLAAGAGLLVGRFLRGAKDVSSDGGSAGSPSGAPARDPRPAAPPETTSTPPGTSGGMGATTGSGPASSPASTPPPAFPPPTPGGPAPTATGGDVHVDRA